MKLQTGGGNLLVAVDIYITNFKSIKAPNIENDSQTPQNSNPQNPQNLNTSQSSTSQNLAPQTPFSREAQEADSALDSVINSTIDSATQSAQNDAIQNPQQPQNLQTPQTQTYTISQTLTSIKTKIFIFIGLCVVGAFVNVFAEEGGGFFVLVAICVWIGTYCVLYSAMESLWERAKSKILKDSVGSYIFMIIVVSGGIGIFEGIADSGYRADVDGGGAILILLLLLWFGCLIYSIILRYRIYKEVAYITNQPLFLAAFWLGVTIFLLPIAMIVYIIAWIMAKEIRQSASADKYR